MRFHQLTIQPLSHTIPSHRILLGVLGNALLLSSTACTNLGVKPWDRDLLASRQMQIGANALELATDEHIYFSKEATSGGRGFGGGGCGCN